MQNVQPAPRLAWLFDMPLLLEIYIAINLAGLAGSVILTHSANHFSNPAEYIPLYFSADAPLLLLVAILAKWRWQSLDAWRDIGLLIGGMTVLVGLAGVVYHLHSNFFAGLTLHSAAYAAPLVAPLAYSGLGLLILLNRMIPVRSLRWARWVVLMAAGGFFGNFVLTLIDHARNGFALQAEWIPILSGVLAACVLLVPVVTLVSRRYLDLCLAVLSLQALVGFIGFGLHMHRNFFAPGGSFFEKTVNGAPPMAPLIFPDLVALALIGLCELAAHLPGEKTTLFDRLFHVTESSSPATRD
jgi:hypothetical protein